MSVLAQSAGFWEVAQGIGGIASVLISLAALWLAVRSAKDSSRSASAAEKTSIAAIEEADLSRKLTEQVGEQLRLQQAEWERLERERNRKPAFAIPTIEAVRAVDPFTEMSIGQLWQAKGLTQTEGMMTTTIGDADSGVRAGLFRFTFQNDGDKAALRPLASITVSSEGATLFRASAQGRDIETIDLQGVEGQAGRHAWRIQELQPGQPESAHYIVATTEADPVYIVIRIEHEDCEQTSREVEISLGSPSAPNLTVRSD